MSYSNESTDIESPMIKSTSVESTITESCHIRVPSLGDSEPENMDMKYSPGAEILKRIASMVMTLYGKLSCKKHIETGSH